MSYPYTTPTMTLVERKITEIFRTRDPLMEDFDGNRSRIRVLEANAALQQTILAGLVEPFDAERATRLRAMANGNAETWAEYDAAHGIGN